MKITQIICNLIVEMGIKDVFAIPGDYNLDLLNEIVKVLNKFVSPLKRP